MNTNTWWRAVCLGSGLVVAAGSAAGAQGLTPAQDHVYQLHRISIEVGGVMIGSVSNTMVTASAHTVWAAHEGFAPISDSTFFMRMGMPQQANESAHWVRTRGTDLRWGLILSGAGIVGMLATSGTAVNGNWTPFWVSTGVSCTGIGFLFAALAHAGNRYPVSTVEELVDPYNTQLRTRISKGQVTGMLGGGDQMLAGLRVTIP